MIRLRTFDAACSDCGAQFESLHLAPHEYGIVNFNSQTGGVAFVNALEEETWQDVTRRINHATKTRGLTGTQRSRLLEYAVEKAADPDDNGSPLYIWGHTPCPQCGGREHINRTPTVPEAYKDVEESPVTFRNWNALSEKQKDEAVEQTANELFTRKTV